MRFWPQDEHQSMYAISLLKHVLVLSKSQGTQKWLAPCGIDVHRVARTIGVCILEKESQRQNDNVNLGIQSTKSGKFGRNICLLT
jgi:hypothetical protein